MKSLDSIQQYIDSQEWYQTIHLSNGITTPGKFRTDAREIFLKKIDFSGQSVIDIGCNSGQYCLLAKKLGASEVLGVDVSEKRINQAKKLAEIEGLEITFKTTNIENIPKRTFDIVLCFAVLTEIVDFTSALKNLLRLTGTVAFIELAIAYHGRLGLSEEAKNTSNRIQFKRSGPYYPGVIKKRKDGTLIAIPTYELLTELIGSDFDVRQLPGGTRYDLIEVRRIGEV